MELEADEVDADFAGNLLRYVYIDDIMVNELLLREGLARVASPGRNRRHLEILQRAESNARAEHLPVWTLVTLTPTITPTATETLTPTATRLVTPTVVPLPPRALPSTPTPARLSPGASPPAPATPTFSPTPVRRADLPPVPFGA